MPRNYRERDFLGSLSVARSKSRSINQKIAEVTANKPSRPPGPRRFAIKSVNFSHTRAISAFVIKCFSFSARLPIFAFMNYMSWDLSLPTF